MSKYKIINYKMDHLVVCDNPKCDFKLESPNPNKVYDLRVFVNKSCPECGENLCTEQDYLNHQKMTKSIDWINKWFGWVAFFWPKLDDSNTKVTKVQHKDGKQIIWEE